MTARLTALYDRWLEYPPDWDERRARLMASRRACALCGATGMFQVHHRTPIALGGDHKDANLIVLCEECHQRQHGGRQFSYRQTTEAGAFGKRIAILQQAIAAGRCVKFSYRKYSGERTTRVVRPEEFSRKGDSQTLCVSGHCYLRHESRIFAVKRMHGVKLVECPASKPTV